MTSSKKGDLSGTTTLCSLFKCYLSMYPEVFLNNVRLMCAQLKANVQTLLNANGFICMYKGKTSAHLHGNLCVCVLSTFTPILQHVVGPERFLFIP